MSEPQRIWRKQNEALVALDLAIRKKRNEQMARALADPTGWELRQLNEHRAKLLADLDATAKALGIVRLVPGPRRATVKLQEAG